MRNWCCRGGGETAVQFMTVLLSKVGRVRLAYASESFALCSDALVYRGLLKVKHSPKLRSPIPFRPVLRLGNFLSTFGNLVTTPDQSNGATPESAP